MSERSKFINRDDVRPWAVPSPSATVGSCACWKLLALYENVSLIQIREDKSGWWRQGWIWALAVHAAAERSGFTSVLLKPMARTFGVPTN